MPNTQSRRAVAAANPIRSCAHTSEECSLNTPKVSSRENLRSRGDQVAPGSSAPGAVHRASGHCHSSETVPIVRQREEGSVRIRRAVAYWSGRRSDCASFALHRAVVSSDLFDLRERYSLTTTRVPIDALPPIYAVGDGASIGSVDRQLAAIRKYAPSKSQSSQSMSRDGIHIGEVNALMRRWKPCPKAR